MKRTPPNVLKNVQKTIWKNSTQIYRRCAKEEINPGGALQENIELVPSANRLIYI